jgi:hypothetical protein
MTEIQKSARKGDAEQRLAGGFRAVGELAKGAASGSQTAQIA